MESGPDPGGHRTAMVSPLSLSEVPATCPAALIAEAREIEPPGNVPRPVTLNRGPPMAGIASHKKRPTTIHIADPILQRRLWICKPKR
jgi:hypothetical protein